MLIKPSLIAGSERRFKQAEFSPDALNRKLGDGPIDMSVERMRLRQRQLLAETGDVAKAEIGLERIIQGNDLDSINYLAKGMAAARSVCRIQLRDLKSNLLGYGSGFLIGPGLLLTNHHVFGKPADAANSIADFDYELDMTGQERAPVRFGFEPGRFFYTNDRLDFSVVAVAPASLSGHEDLEDSLVVPIRVPLPIFRREIPMAPVAPAPGSEGGNGGSPNRGMSNGGKALIARPAVLLPHISPRNGLPMEAVHIDQSTLKSRPGYKANFLGTGRFSVPLPKIPSALKPRIAMLKGSSRQFELKYFNYSVVMNKQRRLAFFSCVNIDGGKQQDVGKREGDSWLRDPRIDDDAQIGNEFYRRQATFEADRSKNPFDRGHLVRRLDATWGDTVAAAKQHGDDSFHFTNCSPQFFSFNQGKQLWAGLEDYTRDVLLEGEEKGIVMNGPVFDGPDADESDLPNSSGRPHKDPSFGGVQIPKYFWKILIRRNEDGLKAAAFLMSQRKQVMEIDRIQEADVFERMSEEDVSVFQVSIADLAKLTKLDFGSLGDADSHEATSIGPRLIKSYEDIRT